jgi:hypothetical protein
MITARAYDLHVDQLFEKIRRIHAVLETAGIPYRIIGGVAVFLHVSERDPERARMTRDLDLAVYRDDLQRITVAAESAGFQYRHAAGLDMLVETSFRLKDKLHIQDMDSVGLITGEIEQGLPVALRERLKEVRAAETLWYRRDQCQFGGNMATNQKDRTGRKWIGKFARSLLATTCLTIASTGAALAGSINTYTEGTSPAPTDFPNTGPGTSLPGGTTETIVSGHVTLSGDQFDWFEITGLGAGTFTVSAIANSGLADTISIFKHLKFVDPA